MSNFYSCIEEINKDVVIIVVSEYLAAQYGVPECTVFSIVFFFQRVLSVGEDGSYVQGVHWRRVKYIGGGSCGRCHFCIDAKTGFLFAIKRVRLSLTVPFYFLPLSINSFRNCNYIGILISRTPMFSNLLIDRTKSCLELQYLIFLS